MRSVRVLVHLLCSRPGKHVLLFCSGGVLLTPVLSASAQFTLPGGIKVQVPRTPTQSTRPEAPQRPERPNAICPKIASWYGKLQAEYPGVDLDRQMMDKVELEAVPLFAEPSFATAFGKPYASLSPTEIDNIHRTQVIPCVQSAYRMQLNPAGVLDYAFNPRLTSGPISPARVPQELAALEQARAALAQQQSQAQSLPPSAESYQTFKQMRASAAAQLNLVWPSERKAYTQAMDAAVARSAEPALNAAIQPLLSAPPSVASLIAIRRARTDNAELFKAVSPELRASDEAQLDARAAAILTPLLRNEHATMLSFNGTTDGLRRGAAWYTTFQRTFVDQLQAPEARPIANEYLTRRSAQLATHQVEWKNRIERATTESAANDVLQQEFPLQTDAQTPTYRQLSALVEERAADLHKREAMGAQYTQGRRHIESASTSAPSSARPPAQAATMSPVAGEPSADEIYDALQARIDAANGAARELQHSCDHLHDSANPNVITGMQCLTASLAGMKGDAYSQQITGFQKLGCAAAVGRPGYMCDYIFSRP